jgi:hypothetical protein
MDENYLIAGMRRTWDGLASQARNQDAVEQMTAEDVRAVVRGYLEGEARMTRIVMEEWHPLPEEQKMRLLELAFPDGIYSRPEGPLKPGDEGIAPARK